MNVNVPLYAQRHFFHCPPPGSREFWSFRFPPPCEIGDEIIFRFDGRAVARAVVSEIEPPGRFRTDWKVFWDPSTFVDLRAGA